MKYLLLIGTLLSATPALALDYCKPSPEDPQTRTCVYDPNQRYVVYGVVGMPVDLRFGENELIKRPEFSFTGLDSKGSPSQTWRGPKGEGGTAGAAQPVPKGRYTTNLPIWPFEKGNASLFVITQMPDGSERSYSFYLHARDPGDCDISPTAPGCPGDIDTTSSISFVYPADKAAEEARASEEKKQAAIVAWRAGRAKRREEVAIGRLKTDPFYGDRNWAYQAKADPKYKFMAPSEVSDNGWLTEFQWPGNVQPPTITIIDPVTHEPREAPTSQTGHMVIVSTTAEWFRLFIGGQKAVMDIHNLKWSPNRPDPETGTTSPDVVRTVIHAGSEK